MYPPKPGDLTYYMAHASGVLFSHLGSSEPSVMFDANLVQLVYRRPNKAPRWARKGGSVRFIPACRPSPENRMLVPRYPVSRSLLMVKSPGIGN
jgi:hypothetical protein